jgi:FtsZ-binding cell division protein ZapB
MKKRRLPKHKQVWMKIRKKAPKVPDITCPVIDDVIDKITKIKELEKIISPAQLKTLKKKMERLRTMNEQLRESGQYWHDECQKLVDDVFKHGKYKF